MPDYKGTEVRTVSFVNTQDLYKVHKIPGLRSSSQTSITGVEKTYDLAPLDADYPEDENAVPALKDVHIHGQKFTLMSKEVKRGEITCDNCEIVIREFDGDEYCPQCGMMNEKQDNLLRDAKAADRYND